MTNVTETLCHKFGENIRTNTSLRQIGTVVSVSCREGYTLTDSDTTVFTCEYAGWSKKMPYCQYTESSGQLFIIVVCSVASVVALGVMICAIYMLLANCQKERIAKVQKREILDTLRELSIYHAVTQDCVGMPPVVYDNMSATLRGRTSSSDEAKPISPQTLTGSEADLATEKAFIY